MNSSNGVVIAVRGPVVDVVFGQGNLPRVYEVLEVSTFNGRSIALEVMEHVGREQVRCVALSSSYDLQRGAPVQSTGDYVKIPVGETTLGRVMNVCWASPWMGWEKLSHLVIGPFDDLDNRRNG
jgi:F-type H+/Na+-transporting ATPase subunit beta